MRQVFTLALLALLGAGKAQTYFNRQLDWFHDYEYLSGVIRFGDSDNILVAGGNWNQSTIYDHFFLARLTPWGDTIWQKSFLPDTNASGNTVTLLKLNEKYSMLYGNAYMADQNPPNYQYFLIKINNQTGDTLWTHELGSKFTEDGGYKMIQTADNGFAITGFSFPTGSTQKTVIFLTKTDSLGNITFRKEYTTDPSKHHVALSIVQISNEGYFVLGYRYYEGPYWGGGAENKIDMVCLRIDALGNQINSVVYPPWEWKQILFYGRDIYPLSNGEFLFCGLKSYAIFQANNTYSSKYFFAKIDANGQFLDSLTLPDWHELSRIDRIKPAFDGNFWVVGTEKDSQNLGATGLIMKIAPDLQVLWKREYRVSPPESLLHEAFWDAVEMPDHGFVLAGRAFGPLEDSTWSNGWVIRVDSLGCLEPGCDTVFTAVHDPPAGEEDAGLSLYPNPTAGALHLALTESDALLLGARLLDAQGRVLYDVQFRREAGWRACSLDLGGQPAGVYVVQVRTTKGWVVRKIIKS